MHYPHELLVNELFGSAICWELLLSISPSLHEYEGCCSFLDRGAPKDLPRRFFVNLSLKKQSKKSINKNININDDNERTFEMKPKRRTCWLWCFVFSILTLTFIEQHSTLSIVTHAIVIKSLRLRTRPLHTRSEQLDQAWLTRWVDELVANLFAFPALSSYSGVQHCILPRISISNAYLVFIVICDQLMVLM